MRKKHTRYVKKSIVFLSRLSYTLTRKLGNLMKIKLLGKNDKLSDAELRYAVQFLSYRLMGQRLSNNITITVENLEYNKRLWGFAWPVHIKKRTNRPRKFGIILFQSRQRAKTISNLAHELVHVKQYATGEFYCYHTGKYKWQNSIIENDLKTVEDRILYREFPWEKEARELEKILKEEYFQHLKEEGLKFDPPDRAGYDRQ